MAASLPNVFLTTSSRKRTTGGELRRNAQEAVAAYFFDQPKPEKIRLHLVRDEVLACA